MGIELIGKLTDGRLYPDLRSSHMLPEFVSDAAFVTAKGSGAVENDRYWNSTVKKIREYTTAWRDEVYRVIDTDVTYNIPADGVNLSSVLPNFEKKVLVANGKINMAAGVYGGVHTIQDIITSDTGFLTIEGDTRAIVGFGFIHGSNPTTNPTNGGSGAITISNSGNDITVARATTNPNFATASIVAGDIVWYVDNSGNYGSITVSSVSGNVITCTAAAPTLGGNGSAVCIIPNRKLDNSILFKAMAGKVLLKGFELVNLYCGIFNTGAYENPNAVGGGILFLQNCVSKSQVNIRQGTLIFGGTDGSLLSACSLFRTSGQSIAAKTGGQVSMSGVAILTSVDSTDGGRTHLYKCLLGRYSGTSASLGGILHLDSCEFRGAVGSHLYANNGGHIYAYNTLIKNVSPTAGYGIQAGKGGHVFIYSCTIEYCIIGGYAVDGGFISSYGTTLVGNDINYSPTAGSLGNNGALIVTS